MPLILLLGLIPVASAGASPPANDQFADAASLVGSSVSGTVAEATLESGEPDHFLGFANSSVWYNWTAPTTGTVRLNSPDTVVGGLYRGSAANSLTKLASGPLPLNVPVTAGTTYRLAVAGTTLIPVSTFTLTLEYVDLPEGPPNDDFADAELITGSLASASGTLTNSTLEEGEPAHPLGSGSVWYEWTAPATASVSFEASVNTPVEIYSGGSLESLTLQASGLQSGTFSAVAGTTYYVAVIFTSVFPASNFTIDLAQETPASPPPNDDLLDAAELSGTDGYQGGTTFAATTEAGEPDHHGAGTNATVWFRWTAPQTRVALIDVCNGPVVALSVYTGGDLSDLTEVASGSCRISFYATSGVTYRFAVGSYSSNSGSFELDFGTHSAPENDMFAGAEVLFGETVTADGTTLGATRESTEPDHGDPEGNASVWYRWTAPATSTVTIGACESESVKALAVYTGSTLGSLVGVVSGSCRATFPATAGTTYRIGVASDAASVGYFSFRLRPFAPPGNDAFSQPVVLSGSSATFGEDLELASHEAGEPDHDGAGGTASVWYRWTAPSSGTVSVSACDYGDIAAVAIYSGTALNSLTSVSSGSCFASFSANAGNTYRIVVDGHSGSGEFGGSLNLWEPPANDDFGNAQILTGSSAIASTNNTGATAQVGEPAHYDIARASVWYSWTPTASGMVSINTCGSGFDTVLAVYTGATLGSLDMVASNDDGGACGGASRVQFTATAGVTYRIAVDSLGSSRGSVSVSLEQDTTPNVRRLTVTKSGGGSGSVTSNPAGINCGDTCWADFTTGSSVTLTATPGPDSIFTGWSGGVCSGKGVCQLVLGQHRSVTATFSTNQTKTLTVNRSGSGTVHSYPTGINCGRTCSSEFLDGASVTLSAEPDPEATFLGWSGGGCSGTGGCQVTLDQTKTVSANFTATTLRTITVSTGGTGSGKVTSSVGGIDCGGTCVAQLVDDTEVTLTALPEEGSTFVGWVGAGCSEMDTCQFKVGSNAAVTATFALPEEPPPAPTYQLTVTSSGSGSGSVEMSPQGTPCGNGCQAYPEGTRVTLVPTPGSGSRFSGWSGGCTGTGTCETTVARDQAFAASFEKAETAPPPNILTLGKVKLDLKKGTASLPVTTPGAGSVSLSGGLVRKSTRFVAGPSTVSLKIIPSAKAKKRLNRERKLRVSISIGFTPDDGSVASRKMAVVLKVSKTRRKK